MNMKSRESKDLVLALFLTLNIKTPIENNDLFLENTKLLLYKRSTLQSSNFIKVVHFKKSELPKFVSVESALLTKRCFFLIM